MSRYQPIPKSYNQWNMRELQYELEIRKLPMSRLKYQRVQTLVDDDISKRPPPIIYSEVNDPDGSLASAQIKLQEEYKRRDASVAEAKEEYEKARMISLKVELESRMEKIKENASIRQWDAEVAAKKAGLNGSPMQGDVVSDNFNSGKDMSDSTGDEHGGGRKDHEGASNGSQVDGRGPSDEDRAKEAAKETADEIE